MTRCARRILYIAIELLRLTVIALILVIVQWRPFLILELLRFGGHCVAALCQCNASVVR